MDDLLPPTKEATDVVSSEGGALGTVSCEESGSCLARWSMPSVAIGVLGSLHNMGVRLTPLLWISNTDTISLKRTTKEVFNLVTRVRLA